MNVKLITHTPEPEKIAAAAAKLCYSSAADIDTILDNLTQEKSEEFIRHLMSMGHSSPLEHISFTFGIEGVSRVLLAELTRHRIASYSVRSMRYVSESEFGYVTPNTIKNKHLDEEYTALVESCRQLYNKMVDAGVPKEDARMILPNSTHTRIIFTMNLRSLLNFLSLRECTRAQWEIRTMANKIADICKKEFPALFSTAGASCVNKGYCPEGDKSCGIAPTMEQLHEAWAMQHHNIY